jgi:hypothetical protein
MRLAILVFRLLAATYGKMSWLAQLTDLIRFRKVGKQVQLGLWRLLSRP